MPSGYEELLEVAEAILFSVPLPPNVLDKYKMIQQEVKTKIDPDRALLQEKLSNAKRKNAALQQQLSTLEQQVSTLTNKIAALHAHHKASLTEVIEQTKHACESSHARHLSELEARSRQDVAGARQMSEDLLASERSFHAAVVEKMEGMCSMFPEVYRNLTNRGAPTSSVFSDTQLGHPNSIPRLHLSNFFECTRLSLNETKHLRIELDETAQDVKEMRRSQQQSQERSYIADKASQAIERKARQVRADVDAAERERQEIIDKIESMERRRKLATVSQHVEPATSLPDVRANPTRANTSNPPSVHSNNLAPPSSQSHLASSISSSLESQQREVEHESRPAFRTQASVERGQDSDEDEKQQQAQPQVDSRSIRPARDIDHTVVMDSTLSEEKDEEEGEEEQVEEIEEKEVEVEDDVGLSDESYDEDLQKAIAKLQATQSDVESKYKRRE